jgi:hypothetical protein
MKEAISGMRKSTYIHSTLIYASMGKKVIMIDGNRKRNQHEEIECIE